MITLKRSIPDSLASTAITVGSGKKSSQRRPKNDIIKRNIQLAGTGDYLTPDERIRVEQILATIDEIDQSANQNSGENSTSLAKIPDDDSDSSANKNRLRKIDNLLEEKYSFSNKLEFSDELR